jgi:hypothetical protein
LAVIALGALTPQAAATCHTEHDALTVAYLEAVDGARQAASNAAQAAETGDGERCQQQKVRAEQHAAQTTEVQDELRVLSLTRGCFGHTADVTAVEDWGHEAIGFLYDPGTRTYALNGVTCSPGD